MNLAVRNLFLLLTCLTLFISCSTAESKNGEENEENSIVNEQSNASEQEGNDYEKQEKYQLLHTSDGWSTWRFSRLVTSYVHDRKEDTYFKCEISLPESWQSDLNNRVNYEFTRREEKEIVFFENIDIEDEKFSINKCRIFIIDYSNNERWLQTEDKFKYLEEETEGIIRDKVHLLVSNTLSYDTMELENSSWLLRYAYYVATVPYEYQNMNHVAAFMVYEDDYVIQMTIDIREGQPGDKEVTEMLEAILSSFKVVETYQTPRVDNY